MSKNFLSNGSIKTTPDSMERFSSNLPVAASTIKPPADESKVRRKIHTRASDRPGGEAIAGSISKILIALLSFMNLTTSGIEYFGGAERTKWIWSTWMLPSRISIFL